jgi:hypothetical protein
MQQSRGADRRTGVAPQLTLRQLPVSDDTIIYGSIGLSSPSEIHGPERPDRSRLALLGLKKRSSEWIKQFLAQ